MIGTSRSLISTGSGGTLADFDVLDVRIVVQGELAVTAGLGLLTEEIAVRRYSD